MQVNLECPILRRYDSSWPIDAILGVQSEEVRQRENDFRRLNGSMATLPDFHSHLLEEATDSFSLFQSGL